MNLVLFTSDELTQNNGPLPGPKIGPVSETLPRHDERAVHLLKVLHKKAGDRFDAGILGGKLGTAVIETIDTGTLSFSLTADTEPPPRTQIRLGVGFPRPIQLRRLLRDCASLGLAAVDLVNTELGEKSYRDTKLLDDGGAHAAFVEGAAQSRDTRLPELAVYPSLSAWLSAKPWTGVPFLAAADNVRPQGSFGEAGYPGMKNGGKSTKPAPVILAVGAERGWSETERALLETAGFLRLSMGSRALRTETACVAAIILLMEKMGLL
ncbi:ribosomal RNA small subunit methyltransferase E [Spirochaetia bacterium]|nr:ribosomal RNA small subunit methyltransferase E [Spirochaetia bacterium]